MRGATGCRPTSGTSLVFQSTRPMRGATRMMMAERGVFSFQSTRPVRGATDGQASPDMFGIKFQSTRPVRGATGLSACRGGSAGISIHAPRAGRDITGVQTSISKSDFNPRAPCGARQTQDLSDKGERYFNPRAPCGARRGCGCRLSQRQDFNPRAPCGARQISHTYHSNEKYFNPRAPCGARLRA